MVGWLELSVGAGQDFLEGRLADNGVFAAGQIQGVDRGGIHEEDAGEIVGRQLGVFLKRFVHQQDFAFGVDAGQDLINDLGLGLISRNFLNQAQFTVGNFVKQGALKRELADFLVNGVLPITRARAEYYSTFDPERAAAGAVAGLAGAFLAPWLLAGTFDFAEILGLRRALAGVGLVGDEGLFQGLDALFAFKFTNGEVLFLGRRAVGAVNFELHGQIIG